MVGAKVKRMSLHTGEVAWWIPLRMDGGMDGSRSGTTLGEVGVIEESGEQFRTHEGSSFSWSFPKESLGEIFKVLR